MYYKSRSWICYDKGRFWIGGGEPLTERHSCFVTYLSSSLILVWYSSPSCAKITTSRDGERLHGSRTVCGNGSRLRRMGDGTLHGPDPLVYCWIRQSSWWCPQCWHASGPQVGGERNCSNFQNGCTHLGLLLGTSPKPANQITPMLNDYKQKY